MTVYLSSLKGARVEESLALFGSAFGVEFLERVLSAPRAVIETWLETGQNDGFSPQQRSAIEALGAMIHLLPASTIENDFLRPMEIGRVLGTMHPSEARTMIALVGAMAAGSFVTVPQTNDPVVDPLLDLAVDVYYLLFLPRSNPHDRILPTAALWNHPARQRFEDAVMLDSSLRKLFPEHSDSGGFSGAYFASTGHGGSIQLWSLSEMLLANSWVRAIAIKTGRPSPLDYATEVRQSVDTLRDSLDGKPCKIPVRIGLAGALLSDDIESVDFGQGVVRRRNEADEAFIPDWLGGKLQTVEADGLATQIDYAGDLVFEVEVHYRVRPTAVDPESRPPDWPSDMRAFEAVGDIADDLRLAFLLRDVIETPVIAASWSHYFDPLSQQGFGGGVRDTRNTQGLQPQVLDRNDVDSWTRIFAEIAAVPSDRIRISKRRLLQAAGERTDPSDVLVDSAIVWESLVGSQSETVLRVSGAMAWLLEPHSRTARLDLQKRVKNLYGLRSKVVHGSHLLTMNEAMAAPREATQLAARALLAMLEERPELLDLKNVAERSNILTLGT